MAEYVYHGTASWGEGLDRGLSRSCIAYCGLGDGAQPYRRAQVGLKLNLDIVLRRRGDIRERGSVLYLGMATEILNLP